MRLSLFSILSLALLTACPSSNPSSINGSLVVHTGIAPTDAGTVRVLLGDGTHYDALVDAKGDVTFKDGALEGPQDVTVVENGVGSENTTVAITVAGVDRDELWLTGSGQSQLQLPNATATLSGTVSGATPGATVTVSLVSKDGWAYGSVGDGGTYELTVQTADGGTAEVLATEVDGNFQPVKVGMRTGVTYQPGSNLTGQDITLDHPLDQTLTVSSDQASKYSGDATVEARVVSPEEGDFNLALRHASGALPLQVPTIAFTAPFDTAKLKVTLDIGSRTDLPTGEASTEQLRDGAGDVSLPLLAPLQISQPALGPLNAPATASASGFALGWSADPNAQAVAFELAAHDGSLDWVVIAPASKGGFAFFALPADASPVPGFKAGDVSVEASQYTYAGLQDFNDFFASDSAHRADTANETRVTSVEGMVTLQ